MLQSFSKSFQILFTFLALQTLLTIKCLNAQSTKLYTGIYSTPYSEYGKATFSYYEDKVSLERVKHGQFNYTLQLVDNMAGSFNQSINGNFTNGLKNGIWKYAMTYKDMPRVDMNIKFNNLTGKVSLTAPFKNGLPNGNWLYSKVLQQRDKSSYLGKIRYSPFELYANTSISLNFKDGRFAGSLSINATIPNALDIKRFSAVGQFDTEGFLDGKWIVRTSDEESISEYNNGVVVKRIRRKLPDGEILEKSIDDSTTSRIKKEYLAGKISKEVLRNQYGLELVTKNVFDNDFASLFFYIADYLCLDNDLLNANLQGDSSMIFLDGKFIDKRKGGLYFEFEKRY